MVRETLWSGFFLSWELRRHGFNNKRVVKVQKQPEVIFKEVSSVDCQLETGR